METVIDKLNKRITKDAAYRCRIEAESKGLKSANKGLVKSLTRAETQKEKYKGENFSLKGRLRRALTEATQACITRVSKEVLDECKQLKEEKRSLKLERGELNKVITNLRCSVKSGEDKLHKAQLEIYEAKKFEGLYWECVDHVYDKNISCTKNQGDGNE